MWIHAEIKDFDISSAKQLFGELSRDFFERYGGKSLSSREGDG